MAKKKTTIVKPSPILASKSNIWVVPSILVVIIGVLFSCYSYLSGRSPSQSKIPVVLYQEYHISRRNLDPQGSYSSYLDEKSQPIVLIGEILNQFPHWDISDVVSLVSSESLSGFFRHQSPIFGPYYDEKRPMHSLSTIQGKPPYDPNVTLPVSKIIPIFHQRSPKIFYSYSSSLYDVNPSLEKQFNLSEMLKLNPSHSSVNIWLGMPGGTTPCHYDGYHNMYY